MAEQSFPSFGLMGRIESTREKHPYMYVADFLRVLSNREAIWPWQCGILTDDRAAS
jgi:hypothetical protein